MSAVVALLQTTIDRQIPICRALGIYVERLDQSGLTFSMPLEPNLNHKRTAFAGSLNALCTIAGWGWVFLLVHELDRSGDIVIRRSSIRYLEPVDTARVTAVCSPTDTQSEEYFLEMLREKDQAKIDVSVTIPGERGPAVSFSGSYVVMQQEA